jgi:hypothetical protein
MNNEKDIKQPFLTQMQGNWNPHQPFLPMLFALTQGNMSDYDAAEKMNIETSNYLMQQNPLYQLPAPMVQPHDLSQFPGVPAPQAQAFRTDPFLPPHLDPALYRQTSTPTPPANNFSGFAMHGNYTAHSTPVQRSGSGSQMPGLPSGPSLLINVSADTQSVMGDDQVPNL